MKIELPKNSFRGIARNEEATLAALAIVPRKRRVLPVAGGHFDAVNETSLATNDDLLRLAAATFDPRRTNRAQAESLIKLLEDAEFLTAEDAYHLSSTLDLGVDEPATLDLYNFVRSNLPEFEVKTRTLALLDDIIALRFRAVS